MHDTQLLCNVISPSKQHAAKIKPIKAPLLIDDPKAAMMKLCRDNKTRYNEAAIGTKFAKFLNNLDGIKRCDIFRYFVQNVLGKMPKGWEPYIYEPRTKAIDVDNLSYPAELHSRALPCVLIDTSPDQRQPQPLAVPDASPPAAWPAVVIFSRQAPAQVPQTTALTTEAGGRRLAPRLALPGHGRTARRAGGQGDCLGRTTGRPLVAGYVAPRPVRRAGGTGSAKKRLDAAWQAQPTRPLPQHSGPGRRRCQVGSGTPRAVPPKTPRPQPASSAAAFRSALRGPPSRVAHRRRRCLRGRFERRPRGRSPYLAARRPSSPWQNYLSPAATCSPCGPRTSRPRPKTRRA